MKTIRQWFELDPLDTLFFKGSEPMVAGQNHEVKTVFPPMPSTVIGAIRTGILLQRGVLREFLKNGEAPAAHPILGTPESPGFQIAGPLFSTGNSSSGFEFFFPAPSIWAANVKKKGDGDALLIHAAESIEREIDFLGLKGSVPSPPWIVPNDKEENPADIKPLMGFWTNRAAFSAIAQGNRKLVFKSSLDGLDSEAPCLLPLSAFHQTEERVGIALDEQAGNRRVQKGHLYATSHVRLAPGVRLWVGVSDPLSPDHLDSTGTLPLGGEQRLVRYRARPEEISAPEAAGAWAMSLAPFPYARLETWGWTDFPRVSGPLIRMGGWDMKKGFHKPMTAFLPAGTSVQVGNESELPFGFIRI